jgi:hypothetical protein
MLEELNKFRNSVTVEFENRDCLPLCTDLSYNVETSLTKWDWKEFVRFMYRSESFDDFTYECFVFKGCCLIFLFQKASLKLDSLLQSQSFY